jgi:hypothetical protein
METRSISDSISDLAGSCLHQAGFPNRVITKEQVMEVLRYMEDCREEGVPLYPQILLTTDLKSCLQAIRPSRVLVCGQADNTGISFRRALKRCAPVVAEGWIMALEISVDGLRYGVLTTEGSANSESLLEQLKAIGEAAETTPYLFFRRFGTRAIQMITQQSESLVSLTLSQELLIGDEHRSQFVAAITKNVESDQLPSTQRFALRLLDRACREGHGILACAIDLNKAGLNEVKQVLPDGAYLSPALTLLPTSAEGMTPSAAVEADNDYRLTGNLIRSMLSTDLMAIFSTDGKLIGYNVYVNTKGDASVNPIGNARRRAFETLKEQIFIDAIFMCSQDGQTTYYARSNG